jgi:hypothetical protein
MSIYLVLIAFLIAIGFILFSIYFLIINVVRIAKAKGEPIDFSGKPGKLT